MGTSDKQERSATLYLERKLGGCSGCKRNGRGQGADVSHWLGLLLGLEKIFLLLRS